MQQVAVLGEEARITRGVVVRAHHRRQLAVRGKECGNPGDEVRGNLDVGIDEEQDVPAGDLRSTVASPCRAASFLQHHDPGADLGGPSGEVVIRAVDHRDDLAGRGVEASKALSAACPRRRSAAHGNDDRHIGRVDLDWRHG